MTALGSPVVPLENGSSASTWPGTKPRAASVAATWSSTWAHLVGMCGWDAARYTERTVGSLLAELTRP